MLQRQRLGAYYASWRDSRDKKQTCADVKDQNKENQEY